MLADPTYQPPAPGPLPPSPKEYPRKAGVLAASYEAGHDYVTVSATLRGGQVIALRLDYAAADRAEAYFRHFDRHDADYWWSCLHREALRTMVWD